MRAIRVVVTLVIVFILSGCGAKSSFESVNNLDYEEDKSFLSSSEDRQIKILNTNLYEYTGIRETKAIAEGNFSVVKIVFPKDLFKEIFLGRSTWYGWVVNLETGKEFLVQAIFSGLEEEYNPFAIAIIDGDESIGMIPEKSKLILLSTTFKLGYDIGGSRFPIDQGRMASDPNYRREVADEHGDLVSDIRVVANGKALVMDAVENWSYFERNSDGTKFYTPLSESQIKKLAKANPQYDFWNKFKYNARLRISANLIATAVNLGFDIVSAANAPSWGADFDSVITRKDMGFALEYLDAMYKQNSSRAAEVMAEQIVAEYNGDNSVSQAGALSKRVVEIKPLKKKVVRKIESRVNNQDKYWEDYKKTAFSTKDSIADQMGKNLPLLGIPDEAVEIFKRLSPYGDKYFALRDKTKISCAAANGKIIFSESRVIRWKKGLRSLPVHIYKLKKDKELYIIGRTVAGQWIRFE